MRPFEAIIDANYRAVTLSDLSSQNIRTIASRLAHPDDPLAV